MKIPLTLLHFFANQNYQILFYFPTQKYHFGIPRPQKYLTNVPVYKNL